MDKDSDRYQNILKYFDKKLVFLLAAFFFFIFNSQPVHAAFFQDFLDPINTFRQIIEGKKLTLFIGMWIASSVLLWRFLGLVFPFLGKPSMKSEKGSLNLPLFGLFLFLSFNSVAPYAATADKTVVSYFSWLAFIIGFTVVEILEVAINKGKARENIPTIVAMNYAAVSILIGPYSISSGTNITSILMLHGFVAAILYSAFGFFKPESERDEKRKQEQAQLQGLVNSMMRAGQIVPPNLLQKAYPNVKDLQDIGTTSKGDLNASYPNLVKLNKLIPTEEYPSINNIETRSYEEQIKQIQDRKEKRKEIIESIKKDYNSTRPGQEAEYLLAVMHDLGADEKNKRNENWVKKYAGNNWDKNIIADKISEFRNPGYERWQRLFKKITPQGPGAAYILIKKRLHDLASQRKTIIELGTEHLKKADEASEKLVGEIRGKIAEIQEINKKIFAYNQLEEEANKNIKTLISAVRKAADSGTSDEERQSILVRIIPLTFDSLMKNNDSIQNMQKTITELVKTDKEISRQIGLTERIIEKISRFKGMFEIDSLAEAETEMEMEAA